MTRTQDNQDTLSIFFSIEYSLEQFQEIHHFVNNLVHSCNIRDRVCNLLSTFTSIFPGYSFLELERFHEEVTQK